MDRTQASGEVKKGTKVGGREVNGERDHLSKKLNEKLSNSRN